MRTSSGLSSCPSVRATIHSTVCWIVWFISHLLPRCCLPPSCYWWWRWRWLPSNRMPIHRCRWYFGRWRIERCDVFVGLMYLLIDSSEWLTIHNIELDNGQTRRTSRRRTDRHSDRMDRQWYGWTDGRTNWQTDTHVTLSAFPASQLMHSSGLCLSEYSVRLFFG